MSEWHEIVVVRRRRRFGRLFWRTWIEVYFDGAPVLAWRQRRGEQTGRVQAYADAGAPTIADAAIYDRPHAPL